MTLIQHRCRKRQLLCAPAGPPAPGQPLKVSSPATDLPTQRSTRGLTRSQPEVTWPQAFFLCLFCFSPPPSLHTVNTFLRDSDANCQTPEITYYSFCSNFPSVLSQADQDIPYGVHGVQLLAPPSHTLKRGRLPWVTSSNYPIRQNRNKLLFLCPRLCGNETTIPNNQIKETETASPVKDNASWSLVKTSRASFS